MRSFPCFLIARIITSLLSGSTLNCNTGSDSADNTGSDSADDSADKFSLVDGLSPAGHETIYIRPGISTRYRDSASHTTPPARAALRPVWLQFVRTSWLFDHFHARVNRQIRSHFNCSYLRNKKVAQLGTTPSR